MSTKHLPFRLSRKEGCLFPRYDHLVIQPLDLFGYDYSDRILQDSTTPSFPDWRLVVRVDTDNNCLYSRCVRQSKRNSLLGIPSEATKKIKNNQVYLFLFVLDSYNWFYIVHQSLCCDLGFINCFVLTVHVRIAVLTIPLTTEALTLYNTVYLHGKRNIKSSLPTPTAVSLTKTAVPLSAVSSSLTTLMMMMMIHPFLLSTGSLVNCEELNACYWLIVKNIRESTHSLD